MKKFFKALAFTILYIGLYALVQVVTHIIIAVASTDFEFSESSLEFVLSHENLTRNIGQTLIVSASVSFLIFSLIFLFRGKNLLAESRITSKVSAAEFIYGGLFGFSANFVLSFIIGLLMESGLFSRTFEHYESNISLTIGQSNFIILLFSVGIIVPIVEETLFRGIITRELNEVFSPLVTIVIQGLIFGAFHMDLIQGIYAAPLGMFFGLMVYKTKSIWPAIAGHMFMNSSSVMLTHPKITEYLSAPQYAENLARYSIVLALVILICFISSFRYYLKHPVKSSEPLGISQ